MFNSKIIHNSWICHCHVGLSAGTGHAWVKYDMSRNCLKGVSTRNWFRKRNFLQYNHSHSADHASFQDNQEKPYSLEHFNLCEDLIGRWKGWCEGQQGELRVLRPTAGSIALFQSQAPSWCSPWIGWSEHLIFRTQGASNAAVLNYVEGYPQAN